MNNEMRNELLLILNIVQSKTKEDKKLHLDWLLERFEEDIKSQLEDLEYEQNELKHNLEVLNYVKEEIKKVGI